MEFLDARRLTGPNLLWDKPGSILDVRCTSAEARPLVAAWESQVRRMLDAVGWQQQETRYWSLAGGVSLAFSAPVDALYAATALNEWAWARCDAALNGAAEAADFESTAAALREQIAAESNPRLLALEAAASDHDLSFLWDDDAVSVGLGKGSQSWPADALPDPSELEWHALSDVPVALVTGTNGKTTTVRLCKHILMHAGREVGMSSTEWIAVNDRIIDRGDWSGPGGARTVLRDGTVDVAVLETARGGLLRRGLGVARADAALICNIAADHLGDFGSQNLHELLNIKWIVSRAVTQRGVLILNADDPLLVSKSAEFTGTLVWFTTDATNAVVNLHTDAGGTAFVRDSGDLLCLQGNAAARICAAAEVPITLGGAARHNVANALAAAALTHALGADLEAIAAGLTSMTQSDNPGRSNVYDVGGFKVLVDFAHNPHAMEAVFEMARALPAKRRLLAFGQAGDRTDELIRELARSAWKIGLDAVNVAELSTYARGRREGEVYAIIRDELLRCGAKPAQIRHFMEESESLDAALDWAGDGDLVIMLALGGSGRVIDRLQAAHRRSPEKNDHPG